MANYQIFLGIHQEGSEDWNGKKIYDTKFPRKFATKHFGRSKLLFPKVWFIFLDWFISDFLQNISQNYRWQHNLYYQHRRG